MKDLLKAIGISIGGIILGIALYLGFSYLSLRSQFKNELDNLKGPGENQIIPPSITNDILAVDSSGGHNSLFSDNCYLPCQVAKIVLRQNQIREKSFSESLDFNIGKIILNSEFSKKQLVDIFTKHIDLGNEVYGFAQGADYYFRKNLDALNSAEAATLIALANVPNKYLKKNDHLIERRNWILGIFRERDLISENEYKSAIESKIDIPN